MNRSEFQEHLGALGLSLPDDQIDAFEAFEYALYEANQVMNLTRVPKEECATRHFLDSLLFQDLIPPESRVLDLGTGPGFPAWPLAMARPDIQVTAVDSNGKMLGFLRTQPLPNLSIVQIRVEEWEAREQFDFTTGRALAPLPIQLEISAKPTRVGGLIAPMRTPDEAFDGDGLTVLGLELERVDFRFLPGTDIRRATPLYRKIASTPGRFPRFWADMKRQPLILS